MPRKKRSYIKISPQTHVRSTQSDRIFFQIPEHKLLPEGLKRKRRLQKYNAYKKDVRAYCEINEINVPDSGAHIIFYIPVPQSWRPSKKSLHHLKPHQSKPDLDNLIKALKDAVMSEDKSVWDYHLSKLWINQETGFTEIATK